MSSYLFLQIVHNYRPQRSCEGYVFTPVCHSVHRGDSASVHAGIPHLPRADPRDQAIPSPEQTPPTRHPPGADTPGTRHPHQRMATVADGTHPTGMHSC